MFDLSVNEGFSKSPRKTSFKTGPWTKDEHNKFLNGIRLYGSSWKKVQELIKTRNCSQIRAHCTQYIRKLRVIIHQQLSDAQIYLPHYNNSQPSGDVVKDTEGRGYTEVMEGLVSEELESIRRMEGDMYRYGGDVVIGIEKHYIKEHIRGNIKLSTAN